MQPSVAQALAVSFLHVQSVNVTSLQIKLLLCKINNSINTLSAAQCQTMSAPVLSFLACTPAW